MDLVFGDSIGSTVHSIVCILKGRMLAVRHFSEVGRNNQRSVVTLLPLVTHPYHFSRLLHHLWRDFNFIYPFYDRLVSIFDNS